MCAAVAIGAVAVGTLAASASASPARNPLAKLTASQIAKKAVADFKSASSFRYSGSGKAAGQTVSLSLSVTSKGCAGSISDSKQGGFVVVMVGTTVWIQPNDKFWETAGVPASGLPAVHGKWVETTGTGSASLYAAFGPLCKRAQIASTLLGKLPSLTKGKTIKISGHPALQLRNKSGSESIYVSVASKPEILRASYHGTVNFSAYNARVNLTPPPASDVITIPGTGSAARSLLHTMAR